MFQYYRMPYLHDPDKQFSCKCWYYDNFSAEHFGYDCDQMFQIFSFHLFDTPLLAKQIQEIIGEHLLQNKEYFQPKIDKQWNNLEEYVENMGKYYPQELEIEAFCQIYKQRCLLIQQGTKLVKAVYGITNSEILFLEVSPFREYSNITDDNFYGQLAYLKVKDQESVIKTLKEFQHQYWSSIANRDYFHYCPTQYLWNPCQPRKTQRTYNEEVLSVTYPLQLVQCCIIELPNKLRKFLINPTRQIVFITDVYSKYRIIRPLLVLDSEWLLSYIQIFAFQFGFMDIFQVDNQCIFKDGRMNSWCNDHGVSFRFNLSKELQEHQTIVNDRLIKIQRRINKLQKQNPLQTVKVDLHTELEILENTFNNTQNELLYGHTPFEIIQKPKEQKIFNTDDYDIDVKHEQLKLVYTFDMVSKQQIMQFRYMMQSLASDDCVDSSEEMPIKKEILHIQKSIRKCKPRHRLQQIDS